MSITYRRFITLLGLILVAAPARTIAQEAVDSEQTLTGIDYDEHLVEQVAAGLKVGIAAQAAVAEVILTSGYVPLNRTQVGMTTEPTDMNGRYVTSVDVVDGVVVVLFGNDASEDLQGKTIGLQPFWTPDHSIRWVCGRLIPATLFRLRATLNGGATAAKKTTVPDYALPKDCR
ncbi:MAG: pilin [Pseudomonadota bacterium]